MRKVILPRRADAVAESSARFEYSEAVRFSRAGDCRQLTAGKVE